MASDRAMIRPRVVFVPGRHQDLQATAAGLGWAGMGWAELG